MACTNVISVNVNGINDDQKRRILFNWFNDHHANIVMLQETWCKTDFDKYKSSCWKGDIINNLSNSSHSKGVTIMFNENL